jgi:hypothetical protein
MRLRRPMDHAQKRALQGTNGISGLGLRSLRLPPYTPALFLARCAAIFVTYPAQNLIRADGNAGELPGRANAVDFESGKRRRHGYTALFLSRSTRRQRDASLRVRTQRTADGFFDCLG